MLSLIQPPIIPACVRRFSADKPNLHVFLFFHPPFCLCFFLKTYLLRTLNQACYSPFFRSQEEGHRKIDISTSGKYNSISPTFRFLQPAAWVLYKAFLVSGYNLARQQEISLALTKTPLIYY